MAAPQHHDHSSSGGSIWLFSRPQLLSVHSPGWFRTPPLHLPALPGESTYGKTSPDLPTWGPGHYSELQIWQTPLLSLHLSYTSSRPEAASGCCHQIPDRSHLGEERFILVSSLRGFCPLRKGMHSGREHASGTPRNRKQRRDRKQKCTINLKAFHDPLPLAWSHFPTFHNLPSKHCEPMEEGRDFTSKTKHLGMSRLGVAAWRFPNSTFLSVTVASWRYLAFGV